MKTPKVIYMNKRFHKKATIEEIDRIIIAYSTEIPMSLGDRFITIGGKEELAKAIHKRLTKE